MTKPPNLIIGDSSVQDVLSGKKPAVGISDLQAHFMRSESDDEGMLIEGGVRDDYLYTQGLDPDVVSAYLDLIAADGELFSLQRINKTARSQSVQDNGPVIDVPRPKKVGKIKHGAAARTYPLSALLEKGAMEKFAFPNSRNYEEEFLVCLKHKKKGFTKMVFGRVEQICERYQDEFVTTTPCVLDDVSEPPSYISPIAKCF